MIPRNAFRTARLASRDNEQLSGIGWIVASPPRVEPLEARALLSVVTYNLASQWSTSANPNGVWRYRAATVTLPHVPNWEGDSFTPAQPGWATSATGHPSPFWFKYSSTVHLTEGTPDWQTGDVVVHTANNTAQNANITWTSPTAGTVTVTGGVWEGRDIGRSNHWSILKNSTTLTGGNVASGDAFSRAHPFAFSAGSGGAAKVQNITVNKGDVIELLLAQTAGVGDYVGVSLTVQETLPPPPATITGTVFNDLNGDGKRQSNEAGLAGWLIYIDANNNGQFDVGEQSVLTGTGGTYKLSVKAGTYTLRSQVRDGFYKTAPHALSYHITLVAGGTFSTGLFGVKAIAPA